MLRDLDSRDTRILKGIAISAIVFHNFFRLTTTLRGNEFSFSPSRFGLFLATAANPPLAVQAFFTFFGHYGVNVFIFLSAYGLSRSRWDDTSSWANFMWGRVRKLYPVFGVAVIPWLICMSYYLGPLKVIKQTMPGIVCMFLGVSTLAGFGLPTIAPWWFIPFILQFYAIWPLLRRLTVKFGWPGLLILSASSMVLTHAADPVLAHWSMNLLLTPIGHLPELCFGIAAARFPLRFNGYLAVSALAVALLGSFMAAVWPLTFFATLLLFLWLYLKLRGTLRSLGVVGWIGSCSPFMFLINGIVRLPFLPLATSPAAQLFFGCASATATLGISAFLREFFVPTRRWAEKRQSTLVTYHSPTDRLSVAGD